MQLLRHYHLSESQRLRPRLQLRDIIKSIPPKPLVGAAPGDGLGRASQSNETLNPWYALVIPGEKPRRGASWRANVLYCFISRPNCVLSDTACCFLPVILFNGIVNYEASVLQLLRIYLI